MISLLVCANFFSILIIATQCFSCIFSPLVFYAGNTVNPRIREGQYDNMKYGYRPSVIDRTKGFARYASSKEYLKCTALWKEKQVKSAMGTEVSTLVNDRPLARTHYFFLSLSLSEDLSPRTIPQD